MRILSLGEFKKAHRELDAKLRKFAGTKRGRKLVTDALVDDWSRGQAFGLNANNVLARIAFAEAATEILERECREDGLSDFYFVTLVSSDFAMSPIAARLFDVQELIDVSRGYLAGHDYLAVVEVAYYGNRVSEKLEQAISWHVHALVWNASEARVDQRLAEFNREHAPFLPGAAPGLKRKFKRKAALARVAYMLKSPLDEYRVWPNAAERIDPVTGEIFENRRKFHQRKRPLRSGAAAMLSAVMGDWTIPDLVFAGGKGRAMRRESLALARRKVSAAVAKIEKRIRRRLG